MSDNTVSWAGVFLGVLALFVTVGLRLYDTRATHEDARAGRVKPFLLDVRAELRGFIEAYSAKSEKESADLFQYSTLSASYTRLAVREGLDIDLEKEVPEIKRLYDDIVGKTSAARNEVITRPDVKADTSSMLYLQELQKAMKSHPEFERKAIELQALVEEWLRKHS